MLFTIVAGLLLLTPPSASPGSPPPAVLAQASHKLMLNFDQTNLVEVVRWMSKNTGKNFIVPERLRNRKLTIVSTTPVTVEEVERAFLSALEVNDLAVVEDGSFSKIIERGHTAPGLAPPPVPAAENPCSEVTGVHKLDEATYELEAQAFSKLLSDTNCLARQARIVPSFKDDKAEGFKLFAIKPGSFYSAIGLQNGDTILRINGLDMASPEKALEVYAKIRNSTAFEVELRRRGETSKLTYRIK